MSVLPSTLDDATMFDLAPVSLWLEDYSAVKALFDAVAAAGRRRPRAYLLANPERVRQCSQRIRVLKVNRKTLSLFDARDLDHLVANLGQVFRDDMFKSHVDELVQLWDGQDAASPATPSTTRCPASVSTSSSTARSCRATRRAGTACWSRSRTSPSAKARGAASR